MMPDLKYQSINTEEPIPYMYRVKKNITITIKLFGGLDAFAGIENYDPEAGLNLKVPENVRQ